MSVFQGTGVEVAAPQHILLWVACRGLNSMGTPCILVCRAAHGCTAQGLHAHAHLYWAGCTIMAICVGSLHGLTEVKGTIENGVAPKSKEVVHLRAGE